MKKGVCPICFKNIYEEVDISSIISFNKVICDKCLKKFKVIDKVTTFYGVSIHYLYEYNTFLKSLLYQFKGCYDVELKDVFLYKFKNKIRLKYFNYIVIYPPSNEKDNIERGFKHMEKMVECLKMKSINMFYKNKEYKQSDHKYKDRHLISNVIEVDKRLINPYKKYLIIDDIFTSGSTIKTIINLLVKNKVKKENIKVIIIGKTADNVEL